MHDAYIHERGKSYAVLRPDRTCICSGVNTMESLGGYSDALLKRTKPKRNKAEKNKTRHENEWNRNNEDDEIRLFQASRT